MLLAKIILARLKDIAITLDSTRRVGTVKLEIGGMLDEDHVP